jgi:hypothetical protein
MAVLSTAIVEQRQIAPIYAIGLRNSDLHVTDHNPATPLPNSRPNCTRQWPRDKNQKGWA